jgi:hypothetical protein
MAFKLRSPLHTDNPYRAKSKEIVARHAKAVAGYKPGSKANPTYGTAENIKEADLKEKGERTNLPLEKPKPTKKAKSNLPASQGGGSPFNNVASLILKATSNKKPKGLSSLLPDSYHAQGPGGRGIAVSGGPEIPAATPGKGSGKIPNLLPAALRPGNNIMITDAGTNTNAKNTIKPKVTKPKNTKTTNTSTKAAEPITSSDSGKSSYKPNMTSAEFFGKDYSKELRNSIASMPKFEKTVTNARSADYDMIRAKGRGKIDRLKTRLDKREGRVANRVEASSMRIKSRQQRSGERYASKMEARTNTGTNPGYLTEQKKLDAFESPKATTRTSGAGNIKANTTVPKLRTPKSNQTVANPSVRINNKVQASKTIDDSKIKSGAKNAKGGQKVKASTYESLTGFKNKKGSSGGFRRGVSVANTSIKRNDLSKGPRA